MPEPRSGMMQVQARVRDPEAVLQRLEWRVIRRLDGLLQGDYRTLFRGFGLDLAEIREYQLHDDVRAIDWNVTARMQTPYVRQFNEDREITAWFLLDLSPSVDFGTVQRRKRDSLVDFTSLLARLLTRRGNRVGAIFFNGAVERVVPAHGGRTQVLRLINDLLGQPRLDHAPATDLSVLLEAACRILRRRSLLFIVSDFISLPGWDKPLSVLVQRHEALAVRLYDPREVELPDVGAVFIEDSETGEQLFLDTHDPGFRRRFAEAAGRREHELQTVFSRAAVDVLALSTEDDLASEILRFAAVRRQRQILATSVSARPRLS